MSDPVLSFNERRRFKNRLKQSLGLSGGKNVDAKGERSDLFTGIGACLLLLIVVGGGTYWFIHHNKTPTPAKNTAYSPATTKQVESATTDDYTKFLNTKDYIKLQALQQSIAMQYYTNGDYVNADKTMTDLVGKVPSSNVSGASYSLLAQIAKSENNTEKFKYYAKLAVARLRTEGQSLQADSLQKQMDGIK